VTPGPVCHKFWFRVRKKNAESCRSRLRHPGSGPTSVKRGNGITLRYRGYTIDRLGVMAHKAEKILLKIMNEWLCNVQLFPKVRILEISMKAFRIFASISGSRLKAVFGYPYPVANSLSCRISNWQTVVKRNFWLAKFLTSYHVRMHRVIFYIPNTLIKLLIRAWEFMFR